MASLPAINPHIPHLAVIPKGLSHGSLIRISGQMLSYDRFDVDIQTGPSIAPQDDVNLHLSVRPHDHVIIRNTYSKHVWHEEERHGGCPIEFNKWFTMIILAEDDSFKININGKHFCEFRHRMPLSKARFIYVHKNVKIRSITLERYDPLLRMFKALLTSDPVYQPFNLAPMPATNPTVPYLAVVPGGFRQGSMLRINGQILDHGRFNVNIQSCVSTDPLEDVNLHLSVRPFDQAIVRNHKSQKVWGTEEKHGGCPINYNEAFTILVLGDKDGYKIAINGKHFCEFKHRLPLETAGYVYIEKNLKIRSVTLDENVPTTPTAPPQPAFHEFQPMSSSTQMYAVPQPYQPALSTSMHYYSPPTTTTHQAMPPPYQTQLNQTVPNFQQYAQHQPSHQYPSQHQRYPN